MTISKHAIEAAGYVWPADHPNTRALQQRIQTAIDAATAELEARLAMKDEALRTLEARDQEARLAIAVRDRSAALMALKTASRGALFASDELALLIGLLQREICYGGLDKESGRRAGLLEKLKALHQASNAVGRTDGLA